MVPVKNCTGCSACCCICPQQAIEMEENREGFLLPVVDYAKCTQCGMCLKVCPVNQIVPIEKIEEPLVYAAWTKDKGVLNQSTSGGVFSEIARNVLAKGGRVFGAAYDEDMTVRHIAVDSWDDLARLRGSKYVQSDVGDSFKLAKNYLEQGRYVLYSGTPCQIAGLYAVVGKNYDNLLTCGLICHGVPSPKVFRMYLDSLKKRYHSKVTGFVFRNKRNGWKYPTVRIEMENGKIINESNLDNHYNLGFLKNVFLRTSCYQCPTKTGEMVADIMIGDFWELIRYKPKLINHKGTSAILIKTHRGRKAIEACCNRMDLHECPFEYLQHDSNLRKCVIAKADRSAFFADLDQLSFAELTKKYMKPRSVIIREIAKLRRFCLKWINQVKRK